MNRIMKSGTLAEPSRCVLLAVASPAFAADPPKPVPDGDKRIAESSTEGRAGRPVGTTPPMPAPADNPKVQPGKVKWHANFADACAAAQKSGKPVLLFQMMGKLDDQFC